MHAKSFQNFGGSDAACHLKQGDFLTGLHLFHPHRLKKISSRNDKFSKTSTPLLLMSMIHTKCCRTCSDAQRPPPETDLVMQLMFFSFFPCLFRKESPVFVVSFAQDSILDIALSRVQAAGVKKKKSCSFKYNLKGGAHCSTKGGKGQLVKTKAPLLTLCTPTHVCIGERNPAALLALYSGHAGGC